MVNNTGLESCLVLIHYYNLSEFKVIDKLITVIYLLISTLYL